MKRITLYIKGAYGNYNFGDDLLVFSLFNVLKNLPGVQPYFLSDEDYFYRLVPHIKMVNSCNFLKIYDHNTLNVVL